MLFCKLLLLIGMITWKTKFGIDQAVQFQVLVYIYAKTSTPAMLVTKSCGKIPMSSNLCTRCEKLLYILNAERLASKIPFLKKTPILANYVYDTARDLFVLGPKSEFQCSRSHTYGYRELIIRVDGGWSESEVFQATISKARESAILMNPELHYVAVGGFGNKYRRCFVICLHSRFCSNEF